jgi:hypothetical protein
LSHAAHQPEFRATVSDGGEVVLTRWQPHLPTPGGSAWSQLRFGGHLAAIFDLQIDRRQNDVDYWIATDLVVCDVYAGPAVASARERMVRFARQLGFMRVWLGHEVIGLDGLVGGGWQATCPRCGAVWTDSTAGFWLTARGAGCFPLGAPG